MKTNTLEKPMSDLKKSDCVTVVNAATILGVSRNTLTTYMNAFGIEKRKLPFDSKAYITKQDLDRLQEFVDEKRRG